ncbi:hypothetical protein [Jiangella alkaliphila]|uniref:Uncharacterized protein n=1 Tax=Jiangella alkaliphila TaxID=419479 RepID=A0A1H2KFZ8_9ACTN|nr:hypothetical protein [Jiangella alkaliphila]SDU67296.1 hypothetical protein SAMN04488563_3760 [Jiangella alkaliphila]
MVSLPRSARLAAWGTAWLHSEASLDDVVDRVRADDEPHDAVDVPGTATATGLSEALVALRGEGTKAFLVALPAPGDPSGLGGPADLNGYAVDAGEAVISDGAPYALVPDVRTFGPPGDQGHLVTWMIRAAEPAPAGPSLADADKELTTSLLAAGSILTDLDVPSWRPEVEALLGDIRANRESDPLPRAFPPQAQAVAARAARLLAVVQFALGDDGGALTTSEATSRRSALTPLERASRSALAAACNALATR